MLKKQIDNKKEARIWNNIGCHFTPEAIVAEFTDFVEKKTAQILDEHSDQLSILDLFAGDGRLGRKIFECLEKHFKSVKITFVEVDSEKTKPITPSERSWRIVNQNAFNYSVPNKFDLVVSNPPYQILTSKDAGKYGFSWLNVKKYARNLYGLGIIKGLDLCRENGVLAVIAPFGWLRGEYCKEFREEIRNRCSEVFVQAYNHRGLFKEVHQDIGFQIFRKKSNENSETFGKIEFKYNGSRIRKLTSQNAHRKKIKDSNLIKVRVGSVVWNRAKEFLSQRKYGHYLLIYGGNISHNGKLNYDIKKYKKRQFVYKDYVDENCIPKPPFLIIRRTMRGAPGKWKIDSCFVKKNIEAVAENHVITVELPKKGIKHSIFQGMLTGELKKFYFFSGNPSISATTVRSLSLKLIRAREISLRKK